MKTHYELLGVEASADAEQIKKAFRREIARYHPDKVVHLGAEFQDMAATRAAELTIAYKTLSDAVMRAQYDAGLAAVPNSRPAPPPEQRTPPPSQPGMRPPTLDEIKTPTPPGDNPSRFAAERAESDAILRRAISVRVYTTIETLHGKCDTPKVKDFDIALVPIAKPRFLGAAPPRVLVRIVDVADGAAIADVFTAASRARLHVAKSPVVVLLFARRVARQQELSKAWDGLAQMRKPPDGPAEVAVIAVDVADWSCRLPPNCSAAVRKIADHICA